MGIQEPFLFFCTFTKGPGSKKKESRTVEEPTEDPTDPYTYRMSQSQRDRDSRQQVVQGLKDRAKERKEVGWLDSYDHLVDVDSALILCEKEPCHSREILVETAGTRAS